MKRKLFIVILGLCILNTEIIAQPELVRLKIGDTAPALTPLKWVKGKPIAEFVKGHVYVLEFGASWCSACYPMIPELTAMAKQYKGKATVASFFVMEYNEDGPTAKNPAYLQRIEKLVSRQGDKIQYTVAVDDPQKSMEMQWVKAANVTGIPVSFVIDKDGKVAWFGSNRQQLKNVIAQVVDDRYQPVTARRETSHSGVANTTQLLEQLAGIAANEDESLIYFSALTTYQPGQKVIPNNAHIDNYKWINTTSDSAMRIGKLQFTNQSLRQLYYKAYGDTLWNYPLSRNLNERVFFDTLKATHFKRAYGKYWYRPILEMMDTSQFQTTLHSTQNKFNYWLSVQPENSSSQQLQKLMQADLQKMFPYTATVEKRRMPCWKLITTPEHAKQLKTKTHGQKYRVFQEQDGNYSVKNAEIRDLIFQLEIRYGATINNQGLEYSDKWQPPFIDRTGIIGEIDYKVNKEDAEKLLMARETGIPFTFEQYQKLLQSNGIQLIKSEINMNVVVIRNPNENQ